MNTHTLGHAYATVNATVNNHCVCTSNVGMVIINMINS